MKQLFYQLSRQSRDSAKNNKRKTLGLVMGLLMTSWLTGSFLVGSINAPSPSIAGDFSGWA